MSVSSADAADDPKDPASIHNPVDDVVREGLRAILPRLGAEGALEDAHAHPESQTQQDRPCRIRRQRLQRGRLEQSF
jgi:hypothetical protein